VVSGSQHPSRPSIAEGDILAARLRQASWLLVLPIMLIRSGVFPTQADPKKWYDRAIRIVGGVLILLTWLIGMIVAWVNGAGRIR
jgi:hypothetical protein